MPDDSPVPALIGVTALGLGSLLAYGAYRNVPVFGPGGLLTGALQTGQLQPVIYGKGATQVRQQQAASGQTALIKTSQGFVLKLLIDPVSAIPPLAWLRHKAFGWTHLPGV
jgi:hypothetical protein